MSLHPAAEKIGLSLDQLNTRGAASLCAAFPPAEARRPAERLETHHMPRHGSWLNLAGIKLSVLARQRLAERMENQERLAKQAAAWQRARATLPPRASTGALLLPTPASNSSASTQSSYLEGTLDRLALARSSVADHGRPARAATFQSLSRGRRWPEGPSTALRFAQDDREFAVHPACSASSSNLQKSA